MTTNHLLLRPHRGRQYSCYRLRNRIATFAELNATRGHPGGRGYATQSCVRKHISNLTQNFIFKWVPSKPTGVIEKKAPGLISSRRISRKRSNGIVQLDHAGDVRGQELPR